MDRLINENAVLSAIGEWIAHNEHTYTNATEYLRNRVKAIKTAEQESTDKENLVVGDCISRKALIEYANNLKDGIGITANDIARFPSIQPKPKTGHWIAIENEEMETVGYYCSECDLPMETEQRTDFCPNCGAKMLPTDSNCDSCKNRNEVDGSNCYECVKGICNNYTVDSEKEWLPQYEGKQVAEGEE